MTDQLLLDFDRAFDLHVTMTAVAEAIDGDRTALAGLVTGAERFVDSTTGGADAHLRSVADLLREEGEDLARRLRMVALGGPEINAGLAALETLRASWDLIDNQSDRQGNHDDDRDGIVSRSDLEWATEHLDGDASRAAQWLLDHPEFFAAVETARHNDDYLRDGGAGFAADDGETDAKLSLDDIDAYITKLDTWATLVPYMASIDIAAHGGDLDGVMSKNDFEAFLDDQTLPPQVRQAAQQVLDDSAYHDTGGIGWNDILIVASFIPVVGDFIDGAMALYYLAHGDWEQAALSGIGLIPIPGLTAGTARGAKAAADELAETTAQRAARQAALDSHRLPNTPWAARVQSPELTSEGVPDPFHAFPREVENWAPLATHRRVPFSLPGGVPGGLQDLYQLPGSYGGKDGIFEWIVRGGKVEHRVFLPDRAATGVPGGKQE